MVDNKANVIDIEDTCQSDSDKKPKKIVIKVKPKPQPPTGGIPSQLMTQIDNNDLKLVRSHTLSASRRTDIPGCYMPIMIQAMTNGYIRVVDKFKRARNVSLNPADAKCIVWWSKMYGIWLDYWRQHNSLMSKYKHIFNYTITGDRKLEPGVQASFNTSIEHLQMLVSLFSPRAIQLRFDPICVYRERGNPAVLNNLDHFHELVDVAEQLGIDHIIFAFCLSYPKVVSRLRKNGYELVNLSIADQKHILDPLIDYCIAHHVQLQTCCISGLIGYRGITQSHCIDGQQISDICGYTSLHREVMQKAKGQRDQCGCADSAECGSYELVCKHGCKYCYANPQ